MSKGWRATSPAYRAQPGHSLRTNFPSHITWARSSSLDLPLYGECLSRSRKASEKERQLLDYLSSNPPLLAFWNQTRRPVKIIFFSHLVQTLAAVTSGHVDERIVYCN